MSKDFIKRIFSSKEKIFAFILLNLIAPIIVMIISFGFINILPTMFRSEHPLVSIIPYSEVSNVDVFSIYLSILGIIVSTYLTIGIFLFQIREEKEKLDSIKQYYYDEIIKNLNNIFYGRVSSISLDHGIWIENSIKIKDDLSEENFNLLSELCAKICNVKTDIDSLNVIGYVSDDWYKIYKNQIAVNQVNSVTDICKLKIIVALNELTNDKSKKINYYKQKYYKNGKEFLLAYNKNGEQYYNLFATDGYELCNCSFAGLTPKNGFGTVYYATGKIETKYIGGFVEGKRSGKGQVLHLDRLIEDGTYQKDRLFNGYKFYLRTSCEGELYNPEQVLGLDFHKCNDEELQYSKKAYYADFEYINGEPKLYSDITEIDVVDSHKKMDALKMDLQNVVKGMKMEINPIIPPNILY